MEDISQPSQNPENQPIVSPNSDKSATSKKGVFIIGIFILLLLAGGAGYLLGTRTVSTQLPFTTQVTESEDAQIQVDPTENLKPTNGQTITSAWKSYTKNELDFSIKHPDSLIPTAVFGGAVWFVENPTNDSPEILIDVNPNQGGSDSITNSIRGYTWVNKAEENVMIDGVKALKISGVLEGQMNAVYIIVRPNYVYTIHSYKDNYQTLEQMISTIQFN